MGLLGAINYDPATAASVVTTTATAMTALSTANLRLTFTVPSNGAVLVRMRGIIHGGTIVPVILFGVLEGSTVRGRQAPDIEQAGTLAATTMVPYSAQFVVTGLTPGASLTWDAAMGVETVASGTALKFGGPDNATANNAFGGFCFELYSI